jgi:hypothetical protein
MRDINISIWALKNGVKIPKKIKLQEILSITLAQKFHNNLYLRGYLQGSENGRVVTIGSENGRVVTIVTEIGESVRTDNSG